MIRPLTRRISVRRISRRRVLWMSSERTGRSTPAKAVSNGKFMRPNRFSGRYGPLKPYRSSVKIVIVGAFNFDGGNLADPQRPAACDIDSPVDLRRVPLGAALRNARAHFVDDDLLAGADLAPDSAGGNL